MNTPVYDTILARRSIREFLDTPVEREKTQLLLKAAMAAPSACNLQPWAFIVVDEPNALADLKNATDLGRFNAPLAIVVCGVYKHIPWQGMGWLFDCGAAAQNIMLEATELGLASVCVGGFDDDKLRGVLELPDDIKPICVIELGYPAYERKPHTWYTEDAVYYQKFDGSRPRIMRTIEMLDEDRKSGLI